MKNDNYAEETLMESKLSTPSIIGAVFGILVAVIVTMLLTMIAGTYWSSFLVMGIIAGGAFCAIFYYAFSKTKLIVTNKRVYGRISFGRQVDLPLDSISAVGTTLFKGIVVSSASGAIKFNFLQNRNELSSLIRQLLVDRQNKANISTPIINQEDSSIDDLKQYKELLDSGVINQEEFDAKKKQLLGL